MEKSTDWWKVSTFALAGLMAGEVLGRFDNGIGRTSEPVVIQVSSDTVSDTVKDAKKDTLPKLSETNLKKELKKQGVQYPHIVFAQAKLESNCGKSDVARKYNNLFGLRKGTEVRDHLPLQQGLRQPGWYSNTLVTNSRFVWYVISNMHVY